MIHRVLLLIASFAASVVIASPPSTTTIMLSGTSREDAVAWEFKSESGRNSGKWSTIAVPSCWEQEGFGDYHYGLDPTPPVVVATYRRRFTVPLMGDGRVRLWFDGVMTDAEVKINGRSAGPVHQGGFSPFHFDITSLLRPGENELEVVVRDQSTDPGVNRSERYADFWMFGGIHRPVFLELLPAEFIDRVAIDARADGGFRMDVFTNETRKADRVTARAFDSGGRPVGGPVEVSVPKGASRVRLEAVFSNAALWTPETPNLYKVEVTLAHGSESIHRITQTFGFRTFEIIEGQGFRLNGKRILLKGVCRPPFRPESGRTLSALDSIEDVKLLKAMNANAVRAVHYPSDRHFLDACDELGLLCVAEVLAWHSPLPEIPGARLVQEMVTRDQNHPSIVMWDNGNHRGFNPKLETVFHEFDLQDRRALHLEPKMDDTVPQPATPGSIPVDTRFYPTFAKLMARLQQRYPVVPMEALHALYDGGGGAGLADYWKAMESSPVGGGLFIWEMVDEAIARTDRNGALDTAGNMSADGLVGPHHEKEASYFTARNIFSPIQIESAEIVPARTAMVVLRNKYSVTNLAKCRFVRRLVNIARPLEHESATLKSPDVRPGASVALDLELSPTNRDFDYVVLEAYGPDGVLARDWSWPLRDRSNYVPHPQDGVVSATEQDGKIEVHAGAMRYVFDQRSARLLQVRRGEILVPFGEGPDLAWSAPPANVLPEYMRDGVARLNTPAADNLPASGSRPGRLTASVPGTAPTTVLLTTGQAKLTQVNARGFDRLEWTVFGDGQLRLEYTYRLEGQFDSFGITFDCDPTPVRSVTWLGNGPYPVWKNRTEGPAFGLWSKQNNRVIPGESFNYPIFEGCHAGVAWYRLESPAWDLLVWIESPNVTARWFTPQWGDTPLNAYAALPPGDLSFLHAVPAIGEKWMPGADLGASGRPAVAAGSYSGALVFRFESSSGDIGVPALPTATTTQ